MLKRDLVFIATILLSAVVVVGYQASNTAWAGVPVSERVQREADVRRIIVNWLECDVCTDGELDAIVALQEEAVPTLIAVLEGGPSPAKLAQAERGLRASYSDITAYAEAHPDRGIVVTQTEQEYVKFYLENFGIQYQTRAAIALARIGDPDAITKARELLEEALGRTERKDLQAILEQALKQLR